MENSSAGNSWSVLTSAMMMRDDHEVLLSAGASAEWVRTDKDSRLPVELRLANEGLAHANDHWYISNAHALYEANVDFVTITNKNYHAIPEELTALSYNHIGDIDIFNDVIYGGLEDRNDGMGIMAAWNTSNLEMIRYRVTEQKDMPWVAVDPETSLLWSCQWGEESTFNIWGAESFELLGTYSLPEGTALPKSIQGGAFYKRDLYLATDEGDAVYRVDRTLGTVTEVLRDAYPNHDYEMEGLDFWDLTEKGLGTMHMYGNFMQLREKAIHHYDEVR